MCRKHTRVYTSPTLNTSTFSGTCQYEKYTIYGNAGPVICSFSYFDTILVSWISSQYHVAAPRFTDSISFILAVFELIENENWQEVVSHVSVLFVMDSKMVFEALLYRFVTLPLEVSFVCSIEYRQICDKSLFNGFGFSFLFFSVPSPLWQQSTRICIRPEIIPIIIDIYFSSFVWYLFLSLSQVHTQIIFKTE